jgi:hypothetical protein
VAIHHLRKTCAVDVLDEITGSTGVSGAVDGMLILKRERGQHEASLFVTGREIEQEQQLALTFDPSTALWTLVGNAEEYRRTRERQEILALLAEQGSDGMTPRQVAEALDKNYHATRSLLRKMAEAGDIRQRNHQYVALTDTTSCYQGRPSGAPERQASTGDQVRGVTSSHLDDTDYGAIHSSRAASSVAHEAPDAGRAMPAQQVSSDGEHFQESNDLQQCQEQGMGDVITMACCHQAEVSPPEKRDQRREDSLASAPQGSATEEASPAALPSRNHCPRHPHARWVRFDTSGQAWCDKLDCWDCYRLMKIGEALEYRCLTDLGGRVVIAQGIAAWSAFVVTQRVFLVVVATEQAMALCKSQRIEVPDLSEEAQRLIEVDPRPP